MVIAPCSMKTLAAVAHGLSDNLIARAADVILKERRRLVLMVRETPFNLAHLRNMTAVTEMGGIVFPPLPSFYNRPASIDEMVDHTVARVMDLLGVGERPGAALGRHDGRRREGRRRLTARWSVRRYRRTGPALPFLFACVFDFPALLVTLAHDFCVLGRRHRRHGHEVFQLRGIAVVINHEALHPY